MSRDDRERWEDRYEEEKWKDARKVYPLLREHVSPVTGGRALDVACGLGHNAMWLVEQGYHALGVDISRVALEKAQTAARERQLADRLLFAQVDLDRFVLPPASFDLVIVIRFLDRDLIPMLHATLKPGGMLIYATLNWRRTQTHPDVSPQYLVGPGELRELFAQLDVLYYDEKGDHSQLVARKRDFASREESNK